MTAKWVKKARNVGRKIRDDPVGAVTDAFVNTVTLGQADNIMEYVVDPLTGKADRDAAKEAARQKMSAAERARDYALQANTSALTGQETDVQGIIDYLTGAQGDVTGQLQGIYGSINPAVSAGSAALGQLQALYGLSGSYPQAVAQERFQTSPGYQFRQAEGEKAIRKLNSATGQLGSGAMYKSLLGYNQGLASDEYGNYVSGLQNLASAFPTSTLANLGTIGLNQSNQYTGNIAKLMGQLSDARTSAYLSEGAINADYETNQGQLLAQLAMNDAASKKLGLQNAINIGTSFFGGNPLEEILRNIFSFGGGGSQMTATENYLNSLGVG